MMHCGPSPSSSNNARALVAFPDTPSSTKLWRASWVRQAGPPLGKITIDSGLIRPDCVTGEFAAGEMLADFAFRVGWLSADVQSAAPPIKAANSSDPEAKDAREGISPVLRSFAHAGLTSPAIVTPKKT